MLPFGVIIPATVPQGSEIPEGLMNNPVLESEDRDEYRNLGMSLGKVSVFMSSLNKFWKYLQDNFHVHTVHLDIIKVFLCTNRCTSELS
jgi:hypothetical protein